MVFGEPRLFFDGSCFAAGRLTIGGYIIGLLRCFSLLAPRYRRLFMLFQKYYRVMERPGGDWGAFRHGSFDDLKDSVGSHLDGLLLSVPDVGDYLALDLNGNVTAICPTSYEKYNGVFYTNVPSLEKLLDDGILVDAPEEIQELDWRLQGRIEALEGALDELDEKLAELEPRMHERRFFRLTEEAQNCQYIFHQLTPMRDGLHLELNVVLDEMEEFVLKPLRAAVEARKEIRMASVDDLIFGANSRGAEVCGTKKDLERERGVSEMVLYGV